MILRFCLRIAISLSVLLLAIAGASPTDDSLADFFPIMGDGLNVTWSGDITGRTSLNSMVGSGYETVMMIEVYIIPPIMPTMTSVTVLRLSPVTLESLLELTTRTVNNVKGLKLHVEYLTGFEKTMKTINKYESALNGPLWLSARILHGPNPPSAPPLSPDEFISITNRYFNKTTLSLGFSSHWRADAPDKMYTWSMIFGMLHYSYPLHPQPVNYQIRAVWLSTSWQKVLWLLGLRESFSITVWSCINDVVDFSGPERLRFRGINDKERIFYNLPENQMETLLAVFSDADEDALQPLNTTWDRDQWVGFENQDGKNFAFFSSEGLGISGTAPRAAIVHSKVQHRPGMNSAMVLRGRVQFVDSETNNATALEIFIRSRSLLDDEDARDDILEGNSDPTGLKFAIHSDGRMITDTCAFNGAPSMGCYDFEIEDSLDGSYDIIRTARTCSDALLPDPLDGSEDRCGVTAENPPDCQQEYYVTVIGGQGGIILEDLTIEGSQQPGDCPTTPGSNEVTPDPNENTQDPSITTPVSKAKSVLISYGFSTLLMISIMAVISVSSVHPLSL